MTVLSRVLPTSALAPPGSRTIVLTAGTPAVLPVMDDGGSRLYAIDFAQIGIPGDPVAQAEPMTTPAGLLASLSATWDAATVLLTAGPALAAGELAIILVVLFASGAVSLQEVLLPVAPVGLVPGTPDGVLTLNGFALTIGGQAVGVASADQPLTVEQSPLTIGGTPILLEA